MNYDAVRSRFKALTLALALLTLASVGYAQSGNLTGDQPSARPSGPAVTTNAVLPIATSKDTVPPLGSGAFSAYCLYRSWYAGSFYCWDARINANSRVFIAVSEYNTGPTDRFLGAAIMTVHNVVPHNGYVQVYLDTGWTSFPINIRMDLLVDP